MAKQFVISEKALVRRLVKKVFAIDYYDEEELNQAAKRYHQVFKELADHPTYNICGRIKDTADKRLFHVDFVLNDEYPHLWEPDLLSFDDFFDNRDYVVNLSNQLEYNMDIFVCKLHSMMEWWDSENMRDSLIDLAKSMFAVSNILHALCEAKDCEGLTSPSIVGPSLAGEINWMDFKAIFLLIMEMATHLWVGFWIPFQREYRGLWRKKTFRPWRASGVETIFNPKHAFWYLLEYLALELEHHHLEQFLFLGDEL